MTGRPPFLWPVLGSQIVGKTLKKKVREKSRFIFVFALSQFSGLDYLGACNRLPFLPIYSREADI